jgi:hypothetical protein
MNDKNLQDIKDTVTDAGKALLDYSKTGAFFLPLNGDLYVAVGTMAGIAHAAGKVMDEAAPAAQAQAELTDDLHNAIMNLPAKAPYDRVRHEAAYKAYVIGHRDARHAAADLVNSFQSEVRLSAVREARNEALEEAAKLVLSKAGQQISFADMTGAIRALKAASPAASKEGDTRG